MIHGEDRLRDAFVRMGAAIRHTMRRMSWRCMPVTFGAAVWLV
jgi:hypothetical protein